MTARITAIDTTPVSMRLMNSTWALNCHGATNRSRSQVGQSLQPSPDPVRRTAAPVTTMAQSAHRATTQIRRYSAGEIPCSNGFTPSG